MEKMKELHHRFYEEIEDAKDYAELAEKYPESEHEFMHLASQELQHARELHEMIMQHAKTSNMHRETSFECMKHSMVKAIEEAEEELE